MWALVVTVAVEGAEGLPLHHSVGDNADLATRQESAKAAAAKPKVIPFPSPPPGPSIGRFHTLPSLQCQLHPSASGGASPDPNAVRNPYGRGGTGWVMQANKSADPVIVPYAAGTCASPLNDEFQLACMAAPDSMEKFWGSHACSVDAFKGGDPDAYFRWTGRAFYARMSAIARVASIIDGHVGSEYFRPHDCATVHRQTGLVCEEEIVARLALRRNSWGGQVERHRGLYDVLSVGRATVGIVLDQRGLVVAAMDRVSNVSGTGDLNIVMYAANGRPRLPVLVGDAALLSLGRGVMVDPTWFGDSVPVELAADVSLQTTNDLAIGEEASWSLRRGSDSTNSSRWLEAIAQTMCQPPSSSFVADPRFCDEVSEPKAHRLSPFLADKRPVVGSLSFAAGQYLGWSERGVIWMIFRPESSETAPLCNASDQSDVALMRPAWLLGRGDRELHMTGSSGVSAELDLARNLTSCKYETPRYDMNTYLSQSDGNGLAARLSQSYRRDVFQVDAPRDPVSDTELVLALVVVIPEALAVILLLLQPKKRHSRWSRWYWRESSSLVVVVIAGAVALLGVGYLDRQEHSGHAWRAAVVRHNRRIPANATEEINVAPHLIDYSGRPVVDNETLIIIARTGYRPNLTRKLLVVSIVSYGALTVIVLVRWAVATWWRSRPDGDVEDGAVGTMPPPHRRWLPRRPRMAAQAAAEEGDPPVDGDGSRGCGSDGGGRTTKVS
ncbi:hypothetical protein MMPV_000549 [Pyropia vietnamensis]